MTAGLAHGLDHAGLAVPDIDAAARAWEAAGFQVTPLAPHLPGGVTGNRCIMLGQGYIELIGMLAGRSATLERFLGRYTGIHILSLSTTDAGAAGARLGGEVVRSERETPWGMARFARVVLAELVPRVQLIEQITPELVWRAEQMVHANGAVGLASIVIATAQPAALAAMLSRAAGRPVVPDLLGGYALRMEGGQVRILPDAGALFPGVTKAFDPFVAGVEIRTADASLVGRVVSAAGAAIRFVAA